MYSQLTNVSLTVMCILNNIRSKFCLGYRKVLKLTKISYIGTLFIVQFIQVKLTKISYIGTLFIVRFIQVKLTKISYIGTLFIVQFIQVKLTKISYIGTLFIVRFIQDFVLFKIQIRQFNDWPWTGH